MALSGSSWVMCRLVTALMSLRASGLHQLSAETAPSPGLSDHLLARA